MVAVDPNLLREGGAWYQDGRWLNVVDPDRDLLGGDGLADALELDDLAVVLPADAPALRLEGSGFVQTGVAVLDLPGGPSNVVLLQRR